ncbi:MAG: DUF3053 domain-containing protein [Ewingella americana]|jgi:hypothetical protein|uniref:DUF3053 domain-containing protein n=1 Tax=Ewingella americana TaxID=41202 RepID=UPI0024326848|nr:DUF3053 domain-containing protein [Ewingella americana]MCI1676723.1 DUF3053 domain-containing protein [Ewingella americana]MCI1853687.1 DUF3053 domain-containing protein [Ewingella americana]MCI1860072.1 DUF3053 domain-containing protein [Ewingella americana]MCI2143203.1 DUF3053 domain-containing protein [Ewingella americana]MCI2165909.1 DUF3053 domain-containing protein [Ewingella americana]
MHTSSLPLASRQDNALRFMLLPFIMLALILALSGCGDKEAAQRKAFIDFLQTRILNLQTIAVPQLTEKERKDFGKYSDDYGLITDFHSQMNEEMNGSLGPVFASLNETVTVDKLLEKRDELQKMAESSKNWREKLVVLRKQADTRHAALKQPDDVKKVYDQAYEKVVVQPSAVAEQAFTLLPKVLTLVVAKADFIKAQGKNVTISGNRLQFDKEATLDKYNAIQQQLVPLNAELIKLSAEMQKMVH